MEHLLLTVEKSLSEEKYVEKYRVINDGDSEFFLTRDNFGIHFPYNCTFEGKEYLHENSCIAHVWCGGDVAWMYAAKPSGRRPFLVCQILHGSFSDYSLSYDVSRVKVGASYRGDIVLHPTDCEIPPGESVEYILEFTFSENSPDVAPLKNQGAMRISADRYSLFAGESVKCRFECVDEWDSVEIFCGDKRVA